MPTTLPIPSVIVEDENASRRSLRLLLERFCPDIDIVGEAIDVGEATELIKAKTPDLVFLDIKLSNQSGFDLLEIFRPLPFQVIFTTAYDQFATRAFRYAALDYLLKPIHYEDLVQAVERFKSRPTMPVADQQIDTLSHNLRSLPPKVALPTREGFHFIELDNVVRCEADSNYTRFHLESGKKVLASKSLKTYEGILTEGGFFRVHRSHLINIKFIERYRKGKNAELEMTNGDVLTVAPFRRELFETFLDQYIKGLL
ncbi:MAG: LytTR family DNA-binding domain-containing protein [Bacteroidota bacterium]